MSQQVKQANIVKELFLLTVGVLFLKVAPTTDNNVCNLRVQKQFDTFFLSQYLLSLFPSAFSGVVDMQVISFSLSYRLSYSSVFFPYSLKAWFFIWAALKANM